jgi:hypothetical protein
MDLYYSGPTCTCIIFVFHDSVLQYFQVLARRIMPPRIVVVECTGKWIPLVDTEKVNYYKSSSYHCLAEHVPSLPLGTNQILKRLAWPWMKAKNNGRGL